MADREREGIAKKVSRFAIVDAEADTSCSTNMENSSQNKAYVRPFLAEIGGRQIKTIRIIHALE